VEGIRTKLASCLPASRVSRGGTGASAVRILATRTAKFFLPRCNKPKKVYSRIRWGDDLGERRRTLPIDKQCSPARQNPRAARAAGGNRFFYLPETSKFFCAEQALGQKMVWDQSLSSPGGTHCRECASPNEPICKRGPKKRHHGSKTRVAGKTKTILRPYVSTGSMGWGAPRLRGFQKTTGGYFRPGGGGGNRGCGPKGL